MFFKKEKERRRTARKNLKISWPSFIIINGTKYPSSLMDISEIGARFILEVNAPLLELNNGLQVTINIKNQSKDVSYKAKIAWWCLVGTRYMLGVEFLEIFSNKHDPLYYLRETLI